MRTINWIRRYPLTAIIILCWFVGGSYFGSDKAYILAQEISRPPAAAQQITDMKYKASPSAPAVVVDRQNTSEDKKAAEKAAAEAAEAERRKHPFSTVKEDYLNDAVFIGDSRTDTLRLYAGWDMATYYVKTGTSIWSIMDDTVSVDGENISITQALAKKKFGKVYIMLGINELGGGTAESFYQKFKSVLADIRKLQPDALIFVEAIMHVSPNVDGTGGVTNAEINARNKLLKKLADNDMVYFIDENEALDDENGALISEYTYDGVHLQAQYVQPWKDFILEHGVVK